MTLHHFGDPCVHCGIGHDDVPPGPCQGDPSKAVPISYRHMELRWDGVDHYLVEFSDGRVTERYHHYSECAPYWHFGWARELQQPPRWNQRLSLNGREKP